MANAIYPLYKQAILDGAPNSDLDVDTPADGVYCALVNTNIYTFSPGHQYYPSLAGIVGTDQRIIAPTVSGLGTFDGGDVAYSNVSDTFVGALVLYRRNPGPSNTWRLVYFYDTPVNGLPFTPIGGNVYVIWNNAGIFTL